MTTYTLCTIATGEFTEARVSGVLALNPPPPGHCWVPGEHNALTRRLAGWIVDDFGSQLPVIEAKSPTPPTETDWVSWRWDAAVERWLEVPKLKLLQANARQPYLAQLVALDDLVRRPVGELALAQVMGQAAPDASVQRLQSIEADKAAVRAHLTAIGEADSPEALTLVLASPPTLQTAGG